MDAATAALYAELPTYYGNDEEPVPIIERWLRSCSAEIEPMRGRVNRLVNGASPAALTDEFRLLTRWERFLNLPVAPESVSEGQRRAIVLGALIGRSVAEGRQWFDAVTAAVGSNDWAHHENNPTDFNLRIELPFGPGTFRAEQLMAFINAVTPAHLILSFTLQGGFIVGISLVGIETI